METPTLETSESFMKVMSALAVAQGQFPPIHKNKTAHVRSEKGNYDFDYATLDACLAAVSPVLAKNGLALVQPWARSADGDEIMVQTFIVHGESGEWLRTKPVRARAGGDVKQVGTAVSYLRRYQLGPVLGIAPEDDVDSGEGDRTITNANEKRSAPPSQRSAPPKQDPSLEPGEDPPAMQGGDEAKAAQARKLISAGDLKGALQAATSLSGSLREEVMAEYRKAKHGAGANGKEAHS